MVIHMNGRAGPPGSRAGSSGSPAERLLDRLQGVKRTAPDRWLARCPAHEDRHPSLSIRELDDGMVLLRCWAGCEFGQIVTAAGLQPADLFPQKTIPAGETRRQRIGKPFPAADILAAVANEALIVGIAARDLAQGASLTEADIARLFTASGRLMKASGFANG